MLYIMFSTWIFNSYNYFRFHVCLSICASTTTTYLVSYWFKSFKCFMSTVLCLGYSYNASQCRDILVCTISFIFINSWNTCYRFFFTYLLLNMNSIKGHVEYFFQTIWNIAIIATRNLAKDDFNVKMLLEIWKWILKCRWGKSFLCISFVQIYFFSITLYFFIQKKAAYTHQHI